MSEKIVGHKTFVDENGNYSHEPLTESEADELWKSVEEADKRRKEAIPDEKTALALMMDCKIRLQEMGWQDPPRFTTNRGSYECQGIEFGSTGIFDLFCNVDDSGRFPWWHASHGDIYPVRPLMIRNFTRNTRAGEQE